MHFGLITLVVALTCKKWPNYHVEPTRDTAHRFLISRGRAAHAERYVPI
jgi:hypothetical protein